MERNELRNPRAVAVAADRAAASSDRAKQNSSSARNQRNTTEPLQLAAKLEISARDSTNQARLQNPK